MLVAKTLAPLGWALTPAFVSAFFSVCVLMAVRSVIPIEFLALAIPEIFTEVVTVLVWDLKLTLMVLPTKAFQFEEIFFASALSKTISPLEGLEPLIKLSALEALFQFFKVDNVVVLRPSLRSTALTV